MNAPHNPNSYRNGPDENGRFGTFGGRFVAETLMPLILELEQAYDAAKVDPAYHAETADGLKHYVGRPSPLYFAERLTEHFRNVATASGLSGGAKIYLKREDLNHTGSHKVNNVLGQILLARRMGKKRIIAETGAGQHGVATATLCARFGLQCIVYMGAVDVDRQAPERLPHEAAGGDGGAGRDGTKTLKDAMNEALRDWVTNVATTHYVHRHGRRPAPYPPMVRDFQSIIGSEARARSRNRKDACRTRSSPASAAARTRWGCSMPSSPTPTSSSTASRPPATASPRACTRRRCPAGDRACCTAPGRTCCGRRRADQGRAFDLGRARLPRRRPRAFLAARSRPRQLSRRRPTRRRWRRSS